MAKFIIRNMITEDLGPIFNLGNSFTWLDGSLCPMKPFHGASYKLDSVHEQVYQVVELPPTGTGLIDTIGAPTYDDVNDRVTRTHTLSDPPLTGNALRLAVNDEADRRLLLAYPLSEQLWGCLKGLQLIKKKAIDGTNLTAGENTIVSGIMTASAFVHDIRVARLALIAGGSHTTEEIKDNANWPTAP